MTASRNAFPAYLLGLGTWFVPLGIQMVLFPWLVAVVLHMDAFTHLPENTSKKSFEVIQVELKR